MTNPTEIVGGLSEQEHGASADADRAATPSGPRQLAGSGIAGIPSAAHTHGPWRIRENARNDQETCDLSICGDIFVLADLTGPQYAHQWPNACLMAAAPEMLETLQWVRGFIANSRAESGYCMCGDPVASHDIYSGHSPVDTHLYYAEQVIEKIDTLIAKASGIETEGQDPKGLGAKPESPTREAGDAQDPAAATPIEKD